MSLANQGKSKPSFEDAGITPKESIDNNEEGIELDNSISSIVDSVVHAPVEKPKKQISIYLDDDVSKEFDKFARKHGKGAKSDLINNFLKKALNV